MKKAILILIVATLIGCGSEPQDDIVKHRSDSIDSLFVKYNKETDEMFDKHNRIMDSIFKKANDDIKNWRHN